MAPPEEMHTAMVNRSIRTIKAELEYLTDASVISPQTLSSLLSQLPPQTLLHAPASVGAVPMGQPIPGAQSPPTAEMAKTSFHDPRQYNNNGVYQQSQPDPHKQHYDPVPSPAPPAYGIPTSQQQQQQGPPPPSMPPLCSAIALYAYKGEDAGDLTLQPNDAIEVTEYMNAEWWKGRSVRTGQVGIFPRSYVRVDEKMPQPPPPSGNGYGYGNNMPVQTNGMGNGEGQAPNKTHEMGKKLGKKFGGAMIFGAGATVGSDLVNAIL